jgi:hypothetical protein
VPINLLTHPQTAYMTPLDCLHDLGGVGRGGKGKGGTINEIVGKCQQKT